MLNWWDISSYFSCNHVIYVKLVKLSSTLWSALLTYLFWSIFWITFWLAVLLLYCPLMTSALLYWPTYSAPCIRVHCDWLLYLFSRLRRRKGIKPATFHLKRHVFLRTGLFHTRLLKKAKWPGNKFILQLPILYTMPSTTEQVIFLCPVVEKIDRGFFMNFS